jgi:hypothetical protein
VLSIHLRRTAIKHAVFQAVRFTGETVAVGDQFTSRDSQVKVAVQSARLVIATCQR